MKKLLNTVYITTEGASLRKDGENFVAEVEGVERARVPFHMFASIVIFGPIFVSPAVIGACAGAGITRPGSKGRSRATCCCFLDEMAPLGLVPYLQAQLLARYLRADLDAYPPWFWK